VTAVVGQRFQQRIEWSLRGADLVEARIVKDRISHITIGVEDTYQITPERGKSEINDTKSVSLE